MQTICGNNYINSMIKKIKTSKKLYMGEWIDRKLRLFLIQVVIETAHDRKINWIQAPGFIRGEKQTVLSLFQASGL
ncbi:MAG: hypothetical protein QNJ51_28150 [Calothrix sp. MO_167.B12]|nr:hypothetical protein [Calothrix sp. MO_167.B12]